MQYVSVKKSVSGDWKLAATTQTSQERTFGNARKTRLKMVQPRRALNCKLVIAARLDRDCALPNRRQHFSDRYPCTNSFL